MSKVTIRQLFITILLFGNGAGILINVFESNTILETISYFTILSNMLVFGFFTFVLFKNGNISKIQTSIKGVVTLIILITFLVYHILLDPFFLVSTYHPPFLGNFFIHTFTPLMVFIDYIIFDIKGRLEYRYIKYWLMVPVIYFIYINIFAVLGGTFEYEGVYRGYPYFFVNPDQIGWLNVIYFLFIISVFVVLLSMLFVFIDKKLKKVVK